MASRCPICNYEISYLIGLREREFTYDGNNIRNDIFSPSRIHSFDCPHCHQKLFTDIKEAKDFLLKNHPEDKVKEKRKIERYVGGGG